MRGAEIRPFAEVGLAQQNGAGIAQQAGNGRIFRRRRTEQREGAGTSLRFVGGVDVVFQKNGDAVQGSAYVILLALVVARFGDRQRIGIDFDDGVQLRVELLNAANVVLGDLARGGAMGRHHRLELGDADVDQLADLSRVVARGVGLGVYCRHQRKLAERWRSRRQRRHSQHGSATDPWRSARPIATAARGTVQSRSHDHFPFLSSQLPIAQGVEVQ